MIFQYCAAVWKNEKTAEKAQEIYQDLRQQRARLSAALDSAVLSLLEMELKETADYSIKLNRSVRSFNLMTPDYSRLFAVLADYLAKLTAASVSGNDTADAANTADISSTTSAAVIGRLMSNVKMGYYPTDPEHIRYLARELSFRKKQP